MQALQEQAYWSMTDDPSDATQAIEVGFDLPGVVYLGAKVSVNAYAWCVRGGHGAGPQ